MSEQEEIYTCPKCHRVKSKGRPGSITQWISLCDCEVLVSAQKAEETSICVDCGKRLVASRPGSITQWIFGSDTCSCQRPTAPREASPFSNGTASSGTVEKRARREPRFLEEPDVAQHIHTIVSPSRGLTRAKRMVLLVVLLVFAGILALVIYKSVSTVSNSALTSDLEAKEAKTDLLEHQAGSDSPPMFYQNDNSDTMELDRREELKTTNKAKIDPAGVLQLNITKCRIREAAVLEKMGKTYYLQSMRLGNCTIGPQAIEGLVRGLRKNKNAHLTAVEFDECKVEKGVFIQIAEIPDLDSVIVADSDFDDDDLAALHNVKLQTLKVLNGQITDEGLDYLNNMTSLKDVEVSLLPGVTVNRIKELRKSLPGAKITIRVPKQGFSKG